ncbi:hypothetical protein [Crocosphaera chwakensis]|uniref:Uncharacterized protein n=1 Tax=Crocosphaera chwakensis CCY0110 TaxID=391612 RepID=A3IT38_9CHRO|nr:hypothetical protein [Crocosphaera chwakensis]EAZ90342.1 hypothetical protein CY0110_04728 [Crocosphaera chwakensis CCY0110]
MNKDNPNIKDDLREEYDLTTLKVRKFGRNRKSFAGHTVRLDDDVAEMFPNSEAVNEALRFLMRVTQQNQSPKR